MREVAIVGAGIGGLTAALALHGRGVGVTVLDQAHQLEAVGAGIQLSCNPNHVLARLGVLDATVAASAEPDSLEVIEGHSGETLLSARLNGWARQRWGTPYLNIHRGDLQQVLVDAVRERLPGALQLGRRVAGVRQDNDSATVVFADGQEISADVVVGADGVHSVLREAVTDVEPPRYTGHVAYRMLLHRSNIPSGSVPPLSVMLRLGRRGHVVSYWVRGGEMYNIVAVAENDQWREENWHTAAEPGELSAAFKDWDSHLRALIDSSGESYKWAVLDHSVPADWARGRIALLGDSCHAMPPYLAQGGAMAIEDAFVLARALAVSSNDVDALQQYSAERVGRVGRVHAGAKQNAIAFHLSGQQRTDRNNVLRQIGKEPQQFMTQMDWLYGHNVTADG